jgi:hypothetical protein
MSEVNIVIKAMNKAAPIFAKVKEDALKMVHGISGRPVTINTAAAKKAMGEVGKESDKAGKKLKEMAATPMGGLVASIGKIGKALAGLAVVGVIGAAIKKVQEWRDEWMMALERVAAAEVDFQKKIADAMQGDLPARRKAEEAELEKGLVHSGEVGAEGARLALRQKQESQMADERIANLQKELDGQIAISAAVQDAKSKLTGLEGTARVVAATMGKEFGEVAEVFSPDAGGMGVVLGSLMENKSSGEAVPGIVEGATRQREMAQRGIADARPVLEKHERKEQERAREIGLKQEELAAAKREKTEILRRHAAEMDVQTAAEERAFRLDRIRGLEKTVEDEMAEAQEFAGQATDWKAAATPGAKVPDWVAKEIVQATNPLADPETRDRMTMGVGVRETFREARRKSLMAGGMDSAEATRQAGMMGGVSSGPRAAGADRMVRVNEKGQETLLKTGILMKKSEADILKLQEKERAGLRLSPAELIKLRNAKAAKEAEGQLKAAEEAQRQLELLRVQAGIDARDTAINTGIIADLLIQNLTAR